MTIKTLFFSLFLYVCLVWVWDAYSHSGPELGLLWTGAGIIAVLAFILGSRLFGWWRLRRARAASRPRPADPAARATVVHEDDAALADLIAEANATLRKAPGYAGKPGRMPLSGMPLYLLVGPEGSGKTSTFLKSGLEPQPLAAQVAGTGPIGPTRLCNLWLARNVIFAELSGRAFSGDLGRWTQLLRVLRGTPSVSPWRAMWSQPDPGLVLRGVIAFSDVKEFTGTPNPERFERLSREWQERLRAVSEVFRVEFPVYQILTRADSIPFFAEFFGRLPEPETAQALGCTLPVRGEAGALPPDATVEAEVKRHNRSFRLLCHALAKRRIMHLAHEPDPARRPAIYEFPRELQRIRSLLVQFLSDTFRAHPLRSGPLLRGYYLTGVRHVEVAAVGMGATRADWSYASTGVDSAKLFVGDATRIIRGEDLRAGKTTADEKTVQRWIFAADVFQNVVLRDHPIQKPLPVDPRLQVYRRGVLGIACGLCLLLCVAFILSWLRNRELLHEISLVKNPDVQLRDGRPSLDQLRSLEAFRFQVARLAEYDRGRPPFKMRWGLYSGDRVFPAAKDSYFRRFQQLLLNDIHGAMVTNLASVPVVPAAADPYDPVYNALKIHLMITSGACKPEPGLVSRVLKQSTAPQLAGGSEWGDLVGRQIDFYAAELLYGNPCRLTQDAVARDRARQYLRNLKGVDRIYSGLVGKVERTTSRPQRLSDLAPNYAQVMRGPAELSPVFTREGWNRFEKAAKEGGVAAGEPCVTGETERFAGQWRQDAELTQAVQRLYVRDYVERWRNYIAGFSVNRYSGPADAAQKLEILSGHKSPLLALFAMAADQSNFAAAQKQDIPDAITKVPFIGTILPKAIKAKEITEKANEASRVSAPNSVSGPDDITRSFQPVQSVVPPGSERWVGEKNSAYIEALAKLGHSMQEISRNTGKSPDPAVHQAAAQDYDKAMDSAKQIERAFKPVGVQGLDMAVQRLLEEPIVHSNGFIIRDFGVAAAGKINAELRAVCARLKPTLHKYPFQPSRDDASLQEVAMWFAPGTGAIWKFEAQTLADFTVKDGTRWKVKDPAGKPQVTQEMLDFLNRAQAIADVFYPNGAGQPQLTYTLRPKLDSSYADATLELEIDGKLHQWTSSLQKQFTWPAPTGAKDLGAVARIRVGAVTVPVASEGGEWGIFRIMGDAEPRPLSGRIVEWKNVRGGNGRLEPIRPAPVRVEIVEFPGGVDVFNPKFFEGFACPAKAVQ